MSNAEIRHQINQYIAQLSPQRLRVAADFLAYLAERESEEATEELLEISGFVEAFEEAKRDIAAGRLTPVEDLQRKY